MKETEGQFFFFGHFIHSIINQLIRKAICRLISIGSPNMQLLLSRTKPKTLKEGFDYVPVQKCVFNGGNTSALQRMRGVVT